MRLLGASALLVFTAIAAQGQRVTFHGVPSSVTSPTPDGRTHSIPSSVTSPVVDQSRTFTIAPDNHRNPFRGPFGTNVPDPFERHRTGRLHRNRFIPVYVPVYNYPVDYGQYYDPEPEQPPVVEHEVVREIIREVEPSQRNAMDGGSREYVTREAPADDTSTAETAAPAKPAAQPAAKTEAAKQDDDDLPITELVFTDGHHVELKNYAIVGKNIFDLTSARVMKKYPIAQLDIAATKKINDERGVEIRLP